MKTVLKLFAFSIALTFFALAICVNLVDIANGMEPMAGNLTMIIGLIMLLTVLVASINEFAKYMAFGRFRIFWNFRRHMEEDARERGDHFIANDYKEERLRKGGWYNEVFLK